MLKQEELDSFSIKTTEDFFVLTYWMIWIKSVIKRRRGNQRAKERNINISSYFDVIGSEQLSTCYYWGEKIV